MRTTTITTPKVPCWVSLLVLWGCSTSSRSNINGSGSSWASAFTLFPPSAYRCLVSPLFAEELPAVWEENWLDQCNTESEIATSVGGSSATASTVSEGKDPFSPDLTDKILPATTYRLGLLGKSFETGKLAEQIFNLLKSQVKISNVETREALLYFALDAAAQQATKVALAQNQLEFIQEGKHTPGEWGDVEKIRFCKSNSTFQSFDEALHHWTLGEDFDFIVNNVPAKPRLLSYDEMADVLDPDGSLRKSFNTTDSPETAQYREEAMLTIFDDDLQGSFSHVYQDALHRSRHAASTPSATPCYSGDDSRGYRPIARQALQTTNTTILEPVAMHVMNSLVSHGVLLVDISNGGQNLALAHQVADFWKNVGEWADALSTRLTGTQSIVLGRHRSSGKIVSVGSKSTSGVSNLDLKGLDSSVQSIWDLLTEIGKDVIRIVTATCSVENGAFIEGEDHNVTKQQEDAEKAASLAVKELVDDGRQRVNLRWGRTQTAQSSATSSSELTILRHKDIGPKEQQMQEFRARVDSTIVTLVPLSVLDGLEVFDDESEQWYRPELKALEFHRKSMPLSTDGSTLPWHAHYVAVLPGSLLQLLSRNEVPSAVSRLGEVTDTRLAATFSLRGKEDATLQLDRYLGGSMGSDMLTECEGRTMERLQNRTYMSGYFV